MTSPFILAVFDSAIVINVLIVFKDVHVTWNDELGVREEIG